MSTHPSPPREPQRERCGPAGLMDELLDAARTELGDPQAVMRLQRTFSSALAASARPDRALLGFVRLAQGGPGRALLRRLTGDPRAIQVLATLFAGSEFLTDVLAAHPECAERLTRSDRLGVRWRPSRVANAARAATAPHATAESKLDALRSLQRKEILRIGACDLLGLWGLAAVTEQLSALADALVGDALATMASARGEPLRGLAVIAPGKLGGYELNYSSDVDVVFVATAATDRATALADELLAGR